MILGSEIVNNFIKLRLRFDETRVGGLAWYHTITHDVCQIDSWFGSKGSRVQVSSGPPFSLVSNVLFLFSGEV